MKVLYVVLLLAYPLVALRRYFEYRYTRSVEAKKALLSAEIGIMCLLLLYTIFAFPLDGKKTTVVFILGIIGYLISMLDFIRVNARLNGQTPV